MANSFRLICALLCGLCTAAQAVQAAPIRFGVSETLPFFDHRLMSDWERYLQKKLGHEVELIHRSSHNDIFDLLLKGELEFAWICPAIYRRHRDQVGQVAMPLFDGDPYYQMLLLGPADEASGIGSIEDLEGKVVAFAEPDTNFGSSLVERALLGREIDPTHFFRRRFYTGDHNKVVLAVLNGLAHAGAVTNQTWQTLRSEQPTTAERLRVIWLSGWRPLPPIVASPTVPVALSTKLSDQLQLMQHTPAGESILKRLHFDRFVAADPQLFSNDSVHSASGGDRLLRCGP